MHYLSKAKTVECRSNPTIFDAFRSITPETESSFDRRESIKFITSLILAIPVSSASALAVEPSSSVGALSTSSSPTDEYTITFKNSDITNYGLGIELSEISFRTNIRIFVKSIKPSSIADYKGVKKDAIVVAINEQSAERTNALGVQKMVARVLASGKDVEIQFRNPEQFSAQLNSLGEGQVATTQIAPAGDTTQRNTDGTVKYGEKVREQNDQRLSVTQLVKPRVCSRGAVVEDLLEIAYQGTVLDTGAIFDGSTVQLQGRGIDDTIYFVLGKQPFGQFPPAWDVALVGMCIGEKRRVIVPPVLAFGAEGLPKRGIPPNAALQYDIDLVSINGIALPQ